MGKHWFPIRQSTWNNPMLSTLSILGPDISRARSHGISSELRTNGRSLQLLHLPRVLPPICRRQIKFYNTKFQVAMSPIASHKAGAGFCRIFEQKVAFVSFWWDSFTAGWLYRDRYAAHRTPSLVLIQKDRKHYKGVNSRWFLGHANHSHIIGSWRVMSICISKQALEE